MPDDAIPLRRRLRCSKCGKAPRSICEFTSVATEFDVLDDGRSRGAIGYHETGDITGAVAICACGHRWKPRGMLHAASLDKEVDHA